MQTVQTNYHNVSNELQQLYTMAQKRVSLAMQLVQ